MWDLCFIKLKIPEVTSVAVFPKATFTAADCSSLVRRGGGWGGEKREIDG